MKLIELIKKAKATGETLFGLELLPPLKGAGNAGIFKAIENVLDYSPAYINITSHREVMKTIVREDGFPEYHVLRRRPGTVGIAASIQRKYGIPAVPHLICGGISKYDIEDTLIDMDFLGLDNLLALRGDKRPNESRFIPHPEGHSYAVELVNQIADMNSGRFLDGEVIDCHHSGFCIGVAGYPETHEAAFSPADDIRRLKKKIDAGAEYVVTQMFFDNEHYFSYVKKCREVGINVPIIPGLKPLVSEKQILGLPSVFNISIPEALRKAVEACGGDSTKVKETGLEWAITQSKELKNQGVEAIHYYTMSRTENIVRIARQVWG